jgi:type IV pilus assembly protein PilA
MKLKQKGFSLIELLIVVAIILVIAAIAIPNFIRAKISANEASAVDSVHAVSTAEIGYSSTYPDVGYSVQLADLGYGGQPICPGIATASCFLDPSLASGVKSGYNFTYTQDTTYTPSVAYTLNADPSMRGFSGQQSYFIDQTNVIRYNPTQPAGPNDNPL